MSATAAKIIYPIEVNEAPAPLRRMGFSDIEQSADWLATRLARRSVLATPQAVRTWLRSCLADNDCWFMRAGPDPEPATAIAMARLVRVPLGAPRAEEVFVFCRDGYQTDAADLYVPMAKWAVNLDCVRLDVDMHSEFDQAGHCTPARPDEAAVWSDGVVLMQTTPIQPTRSPRMAARALAALGRGGDLELVHVNPREIALLIAAGGSGDINPHTGLREFDGGGDSGNYGGNPYTGPIGALTVGGAPATGGILQSYTPSYPSADAPNLPAGTLPIDPSILSAASQWSNSQSGGPGGGITDSFFDPVTNPSAVAYPGNPWYSTNASGNAVFTPTGQSAYDAWQQQQTQSLAANAAGTNSGLGGLLSNPLTGIPLALGLPLGIGLGADALGAGFGAATAGGADATVPASMEAAELSADPAAFNAATALGAGGDLGSGLSAADTAASLSGDTSAPFIGASWTAPAAAGDVPFDLSAAPAAVSTAPVLPAGPSAAAVGDAATGASPFGDVPFDVPAASASSPSVWSQIGSALGLGGGPDTTAGAAGTGAAANSGLLSQVVNSPLTKLGGVAASGLGLVRDVTQANASNPIPGMSNVQQIAQQSATQGAILQQYLTNGTLPPAVQASVDQATQSGIAAIKSRYAGMGIAPGSSQETQDIARLQQNAVVQGATLADQLTQQGISLTELSATLYNNLVGYNTALNTQTGQAISSLATALAGGGNTIKLATG